MLRWCLAGTFLERTEMPDASFRTTVESNNQSNLFPNLLTVDDDLIEKRLAVLI